MKKNTILFLLPVIFLATLIFFAGCQESNKLSDKRARLVGNENLQLKKQLTKKDDEIKALNVRIEKLEAEIVKCEKNTETSVQRVTKSVGDLMGVFSETTQKAATLEAENAHLKEQIEQLKSQAGN